jgi:type I restriction enzyme M protein
LEAVVALPDSLFYNTGISTYFWIVTNRKRSERRGKVQLVDARDFWVKMRKSLGAKRKEISAQQIADITRLYGEFTEGERVKIFPNEAFGYQRITVERPLRLRWEVTADTAPRLALTKQWRKLDSGEQAALSGALKALEGTCGTDRKVMAKALGSVPKPVEKPLWDILAVADPEAPGITNRQGEPEPDPDLRDNENVPLPAVPVAWIGEPEQRLATLEYQTAVRAYMAAEVLPYVPDAWVDHSRTKIGYEIPLTRRFYKYVPPRPLAEIDAEIKALETDIQELLREVTE